MKLKVVSYNIHKGYDWKNTSYNLQQIKDLIIKSEADLVFLQEVEGLNLKNKAKGLVDAQFEFLADSIWPHFSYAQNAVYDHSHHGNLILSKYPIISTENVNLSVNRFEKRGFLICQIQIPGLDNKSFYAGCLHLNLLHRDRKKQYEIIKNKILSLNLKSNISLVVAGDFNDWNQKASDTFEFDLGMREAFKCKNGHYAKTFPALWPLLTLDRIYFKNLNVVNAAVLKNIESDHSSDHLPLFCELEIE